MSLREDLLAAMQVTAAAKPISIEVAGWGMLYVRQPTVEEVDAASEEVEPEDGKKRRFARGAARIICDADGKLVFDINNASDIDLLAKQPWAMLQKVLAAAGPGDASGN